MNQKGTIAGNETEQIKPIEQQLEKQQQANNQLDEKDKISKDDAEHIVNGINEFLQPQFTSIHFSLHEETDRYYVEVIDQKTKKILKEIPEKELLDVYAKMTEYLGLFIDEKL